MKYDLVKQDLEIGGGKSSLLHFIKRFIKHPSYRALLMLRLYQGSNSRFFRFVYKSYSNHIANKYGCELPVNTTVKGALWFPHSGQFIVNSNTILGKNVCIHPWVLIGGMRGKGAPTIGNNVFIGNGAKIIGNVKIGDNVFIAPNTVVTKDVECGATIGGIPAKILNHDGKKNVDLYINPDIE